MAKKKKRNNIITKKGNYYYRIRWYNEFGRQVECTVALNTKNKGKAKERGKVVAREVDDIKDGTLQRFQFEDYFAFKNDEGTSVLISMTMQIIMPEYLTYKESKQRAKTVSRDRVSLNQLCDFIGYSKPVAELNYLDIEGSKGLIQHLQLKGYTNNGINITLRHLRTFFNWLYKKARVVKDPIQFDFLPKGEQEYFIDEYQIQAIHDYIDDESNVIDSFFKRAFIFYEKTGCRAAEPLLGELYGNWLYIDASKSKGHNLRKVQLSEGLKEILLEIQAFRDGYAARKSPNPNEQVYAIISKKLLKITRALNFNTNRKITLKSFRHSYGIRRVYETNGNIFQVAMEMGHKNTNTTLLYLRFQQDEIKQYFPSLIPYIERVEKKGKSTTMVTKSMVIEYSNVNKLST